MALPQPTDVSQVRPHHLSDDLGLHQSAVSEESAEEEEGEAAMTYYPTLDEDLARAREILATGQSLGSHAIYAVDVYDTYKLLESFVAEIERLHSHAAYLQAESDAADRGWGEWLQHIEQLQAEIARLRDRLQIIPGGGDRIEELEAENARLRRATVEPFDDDAEEALDGWLRHEFEEELERLRAENARLRDENTRPPHRCKFCGQPSWIDPSDQQAPVDYCHPEDHGVRAS